MGLFGFLKKKDPEAEKLLETIKADIERQDAERAQICEMADLTPGSIAGKKRRYHYKDVNIWVKWEYGGHYGKSCESIGMKRGDALDLLPPKEKNEDPDAIAVCWKGTEIGFMKTNRLRSMVHQWKAAGLPVLAIVTQVGGEQKIYIEFAFYGAPKS